MPEQLVISDASPLIALLAIGQVELLRHMYKRVLVTDVVRREIHAALPDWIEVSTDYRTFWTNWKYTDFGCLKNESGKSSQGWVRMKMNN